MAKRTKSREDIKKENLARTLGRMKTKVAEREELWLDTFGEFVELCMEEEKVLSKGAIDLAVEMADYFLDKYEERWGQS